MRNHKKMICQILTLLLLPAMLLTGCGKAEDPFQIVLASGFVGDPFVGPYVEKLGLDSEIAYRGFSFGSEGVDGTFFGASVMSMTAVLVAGEIDVLVCDLENAARYARNDMFLDLTAVFTEEELAGYEDRLVNFDMLDEFAEPTGEKTTLCGLDISGNTDLDYILNSDAYALFIVANTADLELSKDVFWKIVNS